MTENNTLEIIQKLIASENKDFVALHGTSLSFVKNLIQNGEINNGGNFDNYFYILRETDTHGVDINESAIFYANVNAVKDLVSEKYPEILEVVKQGKIDPYIYTIGIGTLLTDSSNERVPIGFDVFSSEDMDKIKKSIQFAREENRKGVVIKFSDKFINDFEVLEESSIGQANILLSKPITLDYISSIELLGEYERKELNSVN